MVEAIPDTALDLLVLVNTVRGNPRAAIRDSEGSFAKPTYDDVTRSIERLRLGRMVTRRRGVYQATPEGLLLLKRTMPKFFEGRNEPPSASKPTAPPPKPKRHLRFIRGGRKNGGRGTMKVRLAQDLPMPSFERFEGKDSQDGTGFTTSEGWGWWAWAAFPWTQLRVTIKNDGSWSMWAGYPGKRETWRLRVKGVASTPGMALARVVGILHGDAIVPGGVFPTLPPLKMPTETYQESVARRDLERDAARRRDERDRLQRIADTDEGWYPELLTEWPKSKSGTPGRPWRLIREIGNIEHRVEEKPSWGRDHHLRYFLSGEPVAGLTLTAKRPWRGSQSATIDIVFTAEGYRRQGYAAKLLEHARDYFRAVAHSRELTGAGAKWKGGVGNRRGRASEQWVKLPPVPRVVRPFLTRAVDGLSALHLTWSAGEGEIILYHSGDRSSARAIHDEGLVPQLGEWVEQCLYGATDDEESIQHIRDQPPAAFLDVSPAWVAVKVANKLGKQVQDVTRRDIRKHGHLAIFKVEDDWGVLQVIDPTEETFASATGAVTYDRWWKTPLCEESLWGPPSEPPFGIEPGDYFTLETLEPDVTLVGDALIAFLFGKK